MDLYRTLWETSFDPKRGHDRTLNEFFVSDRLITSADDWVMTANNDTNYLRAILDLRAEPVIPVIPPMGNRQYWVPVSDPRHDFDANLSWDSVGARGGAFALCPPEWLGLLPEGVKRIDMGTPIINNRQLARLDKRISGDPEFAAGSAMLGLLWNPKEISTYDVAFFDVQGVSLDGNNRYVPKFDPRPPVKKR